MPKSRKPGQSARPTSGDERAPGSGSKPPDEPGITPEQVFERLGFAPEVASSLAGDAQGLVTALGNAVAQQAFDVEDRILRRDTGSDPFASIRRLMRAGRAFDQGDGQAFVELARAELGPDASADELARETERLQRTYAEYR